MFRAALESATLFGPHTPLSTMQLDSGHIASAERGTHPTQEDLCLGADPHTDGWPCIVCTYTNAPMHLSCSMCAAPRDAAGHALEPLASSFATESGPCLTSAYALSPVRVRAECALMLWSCAGRMRALQLRPDMVDWCCAEWEDEDSDDNVRAYISAWHYAVYMGAAGATE